VVPGIDTSSGHGSAFEIDPALLGFSCSHTVYYSYAGPGKGASQQQAVCPIRSGAPYSRTDTGRPLGVLAEYLVEQLRALRSPVTVVTHSSGSWVLWAALLDDRDLPVTRVVLLAPLWGSIGYPMAGVEAPGLPGAAGMRLIVRLGRDIHFTTFRPSEPLARTLLAVPGYASSLLARRVPRRIRVIAIQSWFDLVVVGRPVTFEGIVPGCPVLVPHGAVPTSGAAMSQAAAFLSGARRPGCGWWSRLSADLTYSFRVP
jgi:alpha-beta hydrolase superfamily lysophospholipase